MTNILIMLFQIIIALWIISSVSFFFKRLALLRKNLRLKSINTVSVEIISLGALFSPSMKKTPFA